MSVRVNNSIITLENDYIVRKINIEDGVSTIFHQIRSFEITRGAE